ncbi:helicase-related protein [Micromonospora sp. NPDC004540]|uniref:DEAD/DEAH box helicase n=1 Tax=Micromonospora sp. NPDC004540 TaxID=3154457 RepID=UPI0033A25FBE
MHGLVAGELVEIIEWTSAGSGVFVRFRDDLGLESTRMLSEEDLTAVVPVENTGPTLDAAPEAFWLAVEALRLRHAHLLNPLLSVSSSHVEALPHQVQAVYDHLLRNHPQRFLLADDPGAGKTIMAGLFIKEALARDWVRRCLIVVPGSLAEQWQEELAEKFALHFEIFETSLIGGRRLDDDPLREHPFLIARLDQFSRNPRLIELVTNPNKSHYDLAIFDEAHKLSARTWGNKVIKSKRFQFAEAVREATPATLLMTATPHNGKEADYQQFLSLLRPAGQDRYIADAARDGLMRRLVKERLVHLDGSRLFPERRASTVAYRLTPLERDLYEDVSEYVREEMNKVSGDDTKRSVGFALLILQRRLASSPEAILRSLARRHARLQSEAARVQAADRRLAEALAASLGLQPEDPDELSAADAEKYEDDVASVATAARTLEELETEILILERLVQKAEAVREAGVDAKWEALADLLKSDEMYDAAGQRRKIVIFTEHRDTLEYLEQRLFELLPAYTEIQVIHGTISRPDRRLAQIRFTQEPNSSILIATDAAGEGVNLQVAHLMINYDIPWNPNRLEQRFGRIHRIGQRHTCHLWNLVAVDTREGDVFETLLAKLEVQREALGDQVFDVLGQVLTDASLGQLLSGALRGAAPGEIESALDRVSSDLESAVRQRAAASSSLTPTELTALRKAMEQARASSFQPDVVRDFTLRSFATFHGDITPLGSVWRVVHVPERLRARFGSSLMTRYNAVTFERSEGPITSVEPPELISPGHPLLGALIQAVDREHGDALTQGIVLEDDRENDDYTVVTLVAPDSVSTYKIYTSGAEHAVNLALYTDLQVGRPGAPDEVAAANEAIAALGSHHTDARIAAVAYVRGTADPRTGEAWRTARQRLRDELTAAGETPVNALPGQGWDFMTGDDEITFWSAVPALSHAQRRRSEQHTAANVGAAHYILRGIHM